MAFCSYPNVPFCTTLDSTTYCMLNCPPAPPTKQQVIAKVLASTKVCSTKDLLEAYETFEQMRKIFVTEIELRRTIAQSFFDKTAECVAKEPLNEQRWFGQLTPSACTSMNGIFMEIKNLLTVFSGACVLRLHAHDGRLFSITGPHLHMKVAIMALQTLKEWKNGFIKEETRRVIIPPP